MSTKLIMTAIVKLMENFEHIYTCVCSEDHWQVDTYMHWLTQEVLQWTDMPELDHSHSFN